VRTSLLRSSTYVVIEANVLMSKCPLINGFAVDYPLLLLEKSLGCIVFEITNLLSNCSIVLRETDSIIQFTCYWYFWYSLCLWTLRCYILWLKFSIDFIRSESIVIAPESPTNVLYLGLCGFLDFFVRFPAFRGLLGFFDSSGFFLLMDFY
jgi:hypothetical protein